MSKVNLVLMRGLLGKTYSRGMDALAAKAAKLPNVDYVTVEDYGSWRSIRDRIVRYKDRTVLGGHSFGAVAATMIARDLMGTVTFPLLLTVDPSQHWSWLLFKAGPVPIGGNVTLAMNWFQTSGLIGRQKLVANGGRVSNIEVPGTDHKNIDDREDIHARAIQEIAKLK